MKLNATAEYLVGDICNVSDAEEIGSHQGFQQPCASG